MLDANEAALLQSIAQEDVDNVARLVFADWLEEHGESPRADFLRVQCELASSSIPDENRNALATA